MRLKPGVLLGWLAILPPGCAEAVGSTRDGARIEVVDALDATRTVDAVAPWIDAPEVPRDTEADSARDDGEERLTADATADDSTRADSLTDAPATDASLDARHDASTYDTPAEDALDPHVCARAPFVGAGEIVGSLARATERVTSCFDGSAPSPALFGRVVVPPRHMLRATVSGPARVAFFEGCDTTRCVPAQYGATAARLLHPGDEPRTVTLALSTMYAGAPIPVSLRIELTAMRPEDHCATAALLPASGTVTLDPGLAIVAPPRCESGGEEVASFVRVRVPAGQRVVATADDTALRLFADCEATQCLGDATRVGARWVNAGTEAREVLLAASRRSGLGPRAVSVLVEPVPPESRCATAPPLPEGTRVLLHTAGSSDDPVCGASIDVQWFRARVPPGHRLNAATVATARAPLVQLMETCGAPRCLPDADVWGDGRSRSAIWDNESGQAREVFVALSGASASFTLRASVAPIPDTARCDRAPLLSAGPALRDAPLQDRGEPIEGCGGVQRGLLHRVRVPALHRLVASVTASSTDVSAALVSGCPAGACLAAASTTFGPTRVVWINSSSAERELHLLLAQHGGPASVPSVANLDIGLEPPIENARCEGAQALTPGARLDLVRLEEARELALLCDGSLATASALFYVVELPAGRSLVVTAASTPSQATRLVLLDACGGACLAGNTPAFGALAWRNDGPARRVVIAVSDPRMLASPPPRAITFAVE